MGTIRLFIFGFGWAKPAPVNFNQLRNRKTGMVLVASAGIPNRSPIPPSGHQ